MRLGLNFDKVKSAIEVFAHVTVIVSLGLGWITYLENAKQAKRDVSFGVISRLSDSELVGVQRRLSVELARAELSKFSGVAVPRSTMAHFVSSLASTSDNAATFDQDIFALISYFDDVQICVSTETCDADVMQAHVGEVAGRYACLLLPYVNSVRERYLLNDLGDGMAEFTNYSQRC